MITTILVVDDSSSVSKLLAFALRSRKHTVLVAEDGLEAQEILESLESDATVDLMILDINMPRMGGLELLAWLRDQPAWKHLPVLMLTTEGQEDDRDQALALGADEYMLKPFKPTELLDRVEAMLL